MLPCNSRRPVLKSQPYPPWEWHWTWSLAARCGNPPVSLRYLGEDAAKDAAALRGDLVRRRHAHVALSRSIDLPRKRWIVKEWVGGCRASMNCAVKNYMTCVAVLCRENPGGCHSGRWTPLQHPPPASATNNIICSLFNHDILF